VRAIVVMAAVFGLQQGATYPLLALILEAEDHSRSLIGLNAAMLPVGLIVAAPFVATIAVTLATAALVLLASPRLPPVHFAAGQSLTAFLPLAPLLLLAVAGAAAFDQAVLTFLPLYMLEVGASRHAAQLAITAPALGNALLQWPIGRLADRLSRRAAMLACTTATAIGAVLLPAADAGGAWLWGLVFL